MFLKFFKVYFPWKASRLLKEKKRQYPHPFFSRVIKIYSIKSPFSLAFMYVWHETNTHTHTTCVKYVDISVTYDRCK